MKKIFLILFISISLYSVDTPDTLYFLDYDNIKCYGSDSVNMNVGFRTEGSSTNYSTGTTSTTLFENLKNYDIDGTIYTCAPKSYSFDPDDSRYDSSTIYFESDNPSYDYRFNNYRIMEFTTVDFPSECQETPDNNILNGLDYQGKVADNSSCQSLFNDNGDGVDYLYSNINLDSSCVGFCYYNLPDTTNPDPDPDPDTGDTTDPDNNTDTNTNTGESTDLSDLIPYLDEVEEKNQNIKDSLDTLNTNLNTRFDQINSNNQTLDSTMQNIDTSLQNLNTTLQNSNLSNEEPNQEEDLTGLTDDFTINPDIDSELDGFKSNIESTLTSSFDNYSNVFGLGGYGSAPSPIRFTFQSKTYTVFDISYINPYIDQIRNIFLITAYIFGLFMVFRGN